MTRAILFLAALLLALAAAGCDPGANLLDAAASDAGVDAPADASTD